MLQRLICNTLYFTHTNTHDITMSMAVKAISLQYVTRPAKVDHPSTKIADFSYLCSIIRNLVTTYTITTKSISLLWNLMSFL